MASLPHFNPYPRLAPLALTLVSRPQWITPLVSAWSLQNPRLRRHPHFLHSPYTPCFAVFLSLSLLGRLPVFVWCFMGVEFFPA